MFWTLRASFPRNLRTPQSAYDPCHTRPTLAAHCREGPASADLSLPRTPDPHWISLGGVAGARQGVATEGVSPTPVPERKRGLQRVKMAAAAAAAAATEQVCESADAEGLGSGMAWSSPRRAGTRARGPGWGGEAGWQGGAEWGGAAGAVRSQDAGQRPGGSLDSSSFKPVMAAVPRRERQSLPCAACAWTSLSAPSNRADKNNVY